jgi:hypothetical protein
MIFMGLGLMLNGQKLVEDTLAEMTDVEAHHVVLILVVVVATVETAIVVIDTDETVILIETVIEIETVAVIETAIEIVIETVVVTEIVTVIENVVVTVTETVIETVNVALIEKEIKNVNVVVIMNVTVIAAIETEIEIENHQKIMKIMINQTAMENLPITIVIEKKQTSTIVLMAEVKTKKKKTITNLLTD